MITFDTSLFGSVKITSFSCEKQKTLRKTSLEVRCVKGWDYVRQKMAETEVVDRESWPEMVCADFFLNPFTANCENSCLSQCQAFQRLVRSSQTLVNFLSTESIFNQFSVFLKTLNALCVCSQYKHPRAIKRVIRSDKPITSVFLVKSQKYDFGC
jgi:hypothetical protein